jgi:hypothetical protein
MTIFELVKIALDELYDEGLAEHGDKLDAVIKERMGYLSDQYKNLEDPHRKRIKYKDPATRFAYTYMYVAAHGDYLVQLLDKLATKHGGYAFSGDTLRVSCVGGGPGSDVVAILKYLIENSDEPPSKLICYLLDGEQAWADTWTEFSSSLDSSIRLTTNFQPLDVTKPSSWESQKKFLQADLFTLIYFVSEVEAFDTDGVVGAFWKKLFDEAKKGALFAYIDNGADTFNNYFDAQWSKRGDIKCLVSNDNVRWTPRYSEQASDLGSYLTKFGKSPKIQSWLSYRILKKV